MAEMRVVAADQCGQEDAEILTIDEDEFDDEVHVDLWEHRSVEAWIYEQNKRRERQNEHDRRRGRRGPR